MRRFGLASRALSMLERQMKNEPSSFFRSGLPIERARLFVSVGDLKRAIDVLSPVAVEELGPTGCGELLGWKAVLHAAAGEGDRARSLAADSLAVSRGLEARTLSLLAEAVVAVAERDVPGAVSRIDAVIDSKIWDPVVIAVRATPAVGAFIADRADWRGWLQRLLAASSDRTLATKLGLQVPRAAKRKTHLTPRESEVHELIAQGLTNEEIAKLLFISLSTTKVHVKHIYDKLGVRSRLEAARALSEDV
jgi:DNA-binding NarL/FixJ family response regulator